MPAPKNEKDKLIWKEKISKGLIGHTPWNKGKKLVSIYYNERMRQDGAYYLEELKKNAVRSRKYNYDGKRIDQITELNKLRRDRCGFHGRKEWTLKEIKFLKENWNLMLYETLAKELKRSYSSIQHKINKLGLRKNNKWI